MTVKKKKKERKKKVDFWMLTMHWTTSGNEFFVKLKKVLNDFWLMMEFHINLIDKSIKWDHRKWKWTRFQFCGTSSNWNWVQRDAKLWMKFPILIDFFALKGTQVACVTRANLCVCGGDGGSGGGGGGGEYGEFLCVRNGACCLGNEIVMTSNWC